MSIFIPLSCSWLQLEYYMYFKLCCLNPELAQKWSSLSKLSFPLLIPTKVMLKLCIYNCLQFHHIVHKWVVRKCFSYGFLRVYIVKIITKTNKKEMAQSLGEVGCSEHLISTRLSQPCPRSRDFSRNLLLSPLQMPNENLQLEVELLLAGPADLMNPCKGDMQATKPTSVTLLYNMISCIKKKVDF